MSGHDNEGLIDYEDNVHNVATSTVNGTTTSANDVDGKDPKKKRWRRPRDDNAGEDLIDYYEDDSRIHIPNVVDEKDKKKVSGIHPTGFRYFLHLHSMLASHFLFFFAEIFILSRSCCACWGLNTPQQKVGSFLWLSLIYGE